MTAYSPEVERKMKRLFDSFRENDRRRYAAVEALKLGHGGIEYIARVLECDPKTIRLGLEELEGGGDLDTGRSRKKRLCSESRLEGPSDHRIRAVIFSATSPAVDPKGGPCG